MKLKLYVWENDFCGDGVVAFALAENLEQAKRLLHEEINDKGIENELSEQIQEVTTPQAFYHWIVMPDGYID
jgi:hypothetical protein